MTLETKSHLIRSKFLAQKDDKFGNWGFLKQLLLIDTNASIGTRLNTTSEKIFKATVIRQVVTQVLAAEVFPDRNPPEIVVAESEILTHQQLREQHPSLEARVSGEVITMQGGVQFFMLDGIMVQSGILRTPTNASLEDIAVFLLAQNYIPIDSICNIIPISSDTPGR